MISIIKNLNAEQFSIFYENIDIVFDGLVRILNGSCGILVLKENADSFVEFTSCGYESDFYYSFLARGNGNFESIKPGASTKPFPSVTDSFTKGVNVPIS